MKGIPFLSGWAVFAFLLCFSSSAFGAFNPEVLLSSGNGAASDPFIYVTPGGIAFVAYIENGEVHIDAGPTAFTPGGATIVSSGAPRSRPGVFLRPSGLATLMFEEPDSTPGATGDEIFYGSNPGGPFLNFTNLTMSLLPDHSAVISGHANVAQPSIAWVRDDTQGPQIYISVELGAVQFLAAGDQPSIATQSNGAVHVVYERGGDIFYRVGTASGFGPEVPVAQQPAVEESPWIGVDGNGVPHVVYLRDGGVYYARGDGAGGFLPAVTVPTGSTLCSAPRISASSSGVVQIIYLEDGNVWRVGTLAGIFSAVENVSMSASGGVDQPSFGVDAQGRAHVIYRRDGEIYYRNDVEAPTADFTLSTSYGELPLAVTFSDDSGGVVTQRTWDFGDGTTSHDDGPVHVYEQTGSYDVTLTVTGPGGTDSITQSNAVQVISPTNIIRIPDITVFQGEPSVTIPILGTHPDPIQGFQLSFSWDCSVLGVEDLVLDDTATALVNPEFVVVNITQNPNECYLIMGLVIDSTVPFDGRTMPPGVDQRLGNLEANVLFSAPAGPSPIHLSEEGLGDPPIFNIFSVDGISVVPVLQDGTVNVIPFTFPPPALFIRGDTNLSGNVNLADAIAILNFLFANGPTFPCLDTADTNDSGTIDISDAIFLLNFLFSSGAIPPYPFPTPGLDPTPDSLGDC